MGSELGRFLLCNTKNPLQHYMGGWAVFLPPALERVHKKGKLQVFCFFSKVFRFFPGPYSTSMTQMFSCLTVCTVRVRIQIHTHHLAAAYLWNWSWAQEKPWCMTLSCQKGPEALGWLWLHPGPPSALEAKSGHCYHTENSSGSDWEGCWCCLLWDRWEL